MIVAIVISASQRGPLIKCTDRCPGLTLDIALEIYKECLPTA